MQHSKHSYLAVNSKLQVAPHSLHPMLGHRLMATATLGHCNGTWLQMATRFIVNNLLSFNNPRFELQGRIQGWVLEVRIRELKKKRGKNVSRTKMRCILVFSSYPHIDPSFRML